MKCGYYPLKAEVEGLAQQSAVWITKNIWITLTGKSLDNRDFLGKQGNLWKTRKSMDEMEIFHLDNMKICRNSANVIIPMKAVHYRFLHNQV